MYEFGHRLGLHVALLELPLVVSFQQHRTDQPDDRTFIGKYAGDFRAAFNLFLCPGLFRQRLHRTSCIDWFLSALQRAKSAC